MTTTNAHPRQTQEVSQGDRRLLRERETAAILGVSTGTVENIRVRGELPSVKIGRARRYMLGDVFDLIERGRTVLENGNEPARQPARASELDAVDAAPRVAV